MNEIDHPEQIRIQVETRDPDQAASTVADVFPSMHLHLRRPNTAGTLLRHEAVGDSLLSHQIIQISLGSRARGDLSGQVVVGSARAGFAAVRVGRAEIDTTGTFLYPLERFETYWDEFEMELIVLNPVVVSRAASALAGTPEFRLQFLGYEPLNRHLDAHWRSMQAYLRSVLSQDALMTSPLIRGEAMRAAARAVLITFPNTALMQRQRVAQVRSSSVDEAVAFIETHAASDIALEDIAQAANAQVQSLVTAFRAQVGSTPLQYLRETRYRGARADLAAGDPSAGISIAEVGARWGFANAGRSAVEYRRRVGESPSTTLRRW